jgi:hypothetical protein
MQPERRTKRVEREVAMLSVLAGGGSQLHRQSSLLFLLYGIVKHQREVGHREQRGSWVENLNPAMGRGINSRNRVWNRVAKLHRLAGTTTLCLLGSYSPHSGTKVTDTGLALSAGAYTLFLLMREDLGMVTVVVSRLRNQNIFSLLWHI